MFNFYKDYVLGTESLHSHLTQNLHHLISQIGRDKIAVAAAWPDWNSRGFGLRFRILSADKETIHTFDMKVDDLLRAGLIRPMTTASVPDSVTEYVCYNRERGSKNEFSPARLRRLIKRNGAAAINYTVLKKDHERHPHVLNMVSIGTGNRAFRIYLKRTVIHDNFNMRSGGGRGYGLGITCPVF